jgi:hypothetical protein
MPLTDIVQTQEPPYFCINTERNGFFFGFVRTKQLFFNQTKLFTMNSTLQILIALLISLGIMMSQNEWNNLDQSQQEQYQQKIITDEIHI